MPAVLNAANDMAVHLFLKGRITFQDIPKIIKHVMELHRPRKGTITAYKKAEQWAQDMVRQYVC
jgi:1-deoxy-D-xylulose-5-phosphate reductoisomerase